MVTFDFLLLLTIYACDAAYDLLWHDNMETGSGWNASGAVSNEQYNCHIGHCVRLLSEASITRQHLSTQNYYDVHITYALQVSNLKPFEFCGVYYAVAGGAEWTLLQQYDIDGEMHKNEVVNLPPDAYNKKDVRIKFAFSASTDKKRKSKTQINGACYVDEVHLYGQPRLMGAFLDMKAPQVIWYDAMDSGDGWYFENTSDHTEHCYIGDCVKMTNNAYIERDNLSTENFKHVQLRYSVLTRSLAEHDACNVYYSVDEKAFDQTRWVLIGSYSQSVNDQYQLNEIVDLALDADNNGNVQIKFNLTTQSTSEQQTYCYIDEVYLLGVQNVVFINGYTAGSQILIAILTYNIFY